MAAWPPIGNRSTTINNTIGTSATKNPMLASSTSASGRTLLSLGACFLLVGWIKLSSLGQAISMALSCKNELAFVDSSITKPSKDDQKYVVCKRCNNMVVPWIVRSLSPTTGRSVLWIDTVYGIWNDLK
nr:uncharacterized protein LOC109169142 [Ipomoea batatas]